MSYVIAIVDQNTCKTFPSASDAPKGSVVFSSPEEMAQTIPRHSLDSLRAKILGENVPASPSADVAATRLWHVLSLGADFVKVDWSSAGYSRRKDNFGNNKISSVSPIELIQLIWVRGKDRMADYFYGKLPKQARQIVDMLVDDGRGIWTNEQANAVILAREAEIDTRQGALVVFKYYKSKLFQFHILKRVSYVEFASRPEFAGLSIQNKE